MLKADQPSKLNEVSISIGNPTQLEVSAKVSDSNSVEYGPWIHVNFGRKKLKIQGS